MTEVTYTPLGCYRPVTQMISELTGTFVCRKFKPEHANIIIGIHTLEQCLDLTNKAQATIYIDFINSCTQSIRPKK